MEHAEREGINRQRSIDQREQEREEAAQIEQRKEASRDSAPKADVVTKDEIELFVRAVRLGPVMADQSKIELTDVIRKNDFRGDNLKEAVDFFLKHFDAKRGVNEALLINKLSEMLFNGMQAEKFYMVMCERVPQEPTEEAEIAKYKKCLYGVRCDKCSKELLKLQELYNKTEDDNKKQEIVAMIDKLDKYYQMLQQKRSSL
jgi:hypothetical protein